MEKVHEIFARGKENGVRELKILGKEETLEIEPGLNPEFVGALYAPTAAIINPWGLCIALAENAVLNGAKLHLNTEVKKIVRKNSHYLIDTTRGTVEARYIVNAAGTHSDKVSEMAVDPFFKITPLKGEYFLMDKSQGGALKHVVFQTPNEFGKGVLIAPTVHGNLIVGPSTEKTVDPDDTAVTSLGLEKILNTSKLTCKKIDFADSIRNFAGIRATAEEIDDFIIEASKPDFINVAAIKSPGLSSAPAIALDVVKLLGENGLELKTKSRFEEYRSPKLFKDMSENEKVEALKREKNYGRVICRCETITEGDILASLKSPIPPASIDGVKRRIRPGSGRCQGGFCGPRVHELLSRELGISMEEVCQDLEGSFILSGKTKEDANRDE